MIPIRILDEPKPIESPYIILYKRPQRLNQLISLNGNPGHDAGALLQSEQFIKQMLVSSDSLRGLVIHFQPTATYRSLIDVMNIVLKYKLKTYELEQNRILIWYEPPLLPNKTWIKVEPWECIQFLDAQATRKRAILFREAEMYLLKELSMGWLVLALVFGVGAWLFFYRKKRV